MSNNSNIREGEFLVLIALIMSLGALSIDAILPALPVIGDSFNVSSGNTIQQVVSVLMLGLTIGQLFYGPLSDRIGRRFALLIGVGIFMVGSLVSVLSGNFTILLAARFLQGFGGAATRIVSMALIRDKYEGAAMARIMSLAVGIFILIPIIAPTFGQSILLISGWQAIFWIIFILSGIVMVWFWLRQPETLDPEHKTKAGIRPVLDGLWAITSNRMALGYTLAMGLVSTGYVAYLLSAEQIFHDIYHTGDLFAIYFALAALSIGVASFVNAQIVERFNMHRIIRAATIGIIVVSFGAASMGVVGTLPLAGFLATLAIIFFCIGLMLGNMNAIALEPLGHIAGLANSAISFVSGMISLVIGTALGNAFNFTIQPLMFGILSTSVLALAIVIWADSQQSQHQPLIIKT